MSALARETLRECRGDVGKAIEQLLARLKADKALLRSLVETAVRFTIQEYVHEANRSKRRAFLEVVGRSASDNRRKAVAHITGMSMCILDIGMEDGHALRDCLGKDLDARINHYVKQGSRMLHMGRFLAAIRKRVADDATVGSVWTGQEADALWQETSHG